MSDIIEACCVEQDEIDVQEAQNGVQDADANLFKLSSMRQNCFEGQKVLRGKRTLKDTRVESGDAQSEYKPIAALEEVLLNCNHCDSVWRNAFG